ncbi:hypothetical protein SAMN05192575_107152 [Nocardioides alpinus]|nr:hypothetical protein [Nocardioides alpinus]SFB32045.1 hypothetical protein SAMN05192575_107152 [Nocardioides alpinus]
MARTASRNRRVGESMWSYLESSAFPGDDRVRDQLDRMVSALPFENRGDVVSRLKDSDDRRVKDTVSELVVHQGLLEVGWTDIEVEPTTPDGKTDYRLSSIGLHLEVTRIGESGPEHGDRQRKYQVLQELNQLDCGRFSLLATLHSGANMPSVKRVRRDVEGWLASLDPLVERAKLESNPSTYAVPSARLGFDDWTVDLEAHPLAPGAASETIISTIVERFSSGPVTVESIRNALSKKRHQHRRLGEPLVVVLDVSNGMASSATIADALYGARPLMGWDRPVDANALWSTPERSGCQPSTTPQSPQIVGVLVVDHIHITGLEAIEATYWLPPGVSSSVLQGPWSTARWVAGQNYGADIDIMAGASRYFVAFS